MKHILLTIALTAMILAPVSQVNADGSAANVVSVTSELKANPVLTSPDGRLVVSFDLADTESPTYSVQYDGKQMLEPSPIGIMLDMGAKPTLEGLPQGREAGWGDFTRGLKIVSINDTDEETAYELTRIKQASVCHAYIKRIIELTNEAKQTVFFEFRVSDNDIAIRYNVPEGRFRRSTRVLYENTGFRFPDGTTTFLTPQSDAMIGWQRSKPSYEEGYSNDGEMNVASQYGHGYTFPCLFHVGDRGWVLVSETGVDSRYCGSRLSDCVDNTYKVSFPLPDENNGNGTVSPAMRLPGSTPWRTITVGSDLKPIVETTVPWDHVEPLYETSHDYRFGRSAWSWIVWMDASCNWDDQVKYIDMAAEMHFEYILIDAGWDQNIGYEKMEELIKYANSKNVDVFLWYSSSGNWNDIIQSPINRMDNSIVRKKEMAWLEKVGVKGIKVDFWGGDKQQTMQLYEEVLSDADDHGLMVIFHGCTIPRGWERMYPNYVGSEAVLASENMSFGQGACNEEAFKATLHPFIRNTVGCMEFGGCFMNRVLNRANGGRGSRLVTGPVFQCCTEILFQNPIQNIAICPNNLSDAPALCMEWLKTVPTTWQQTRFIDGYPGKYIVLARQDLQGKWHVAAVNATDAPLTLNLDLSFLGAGQAQCYSDSAGPDFANPSLTELKIRDGKKCKLTVVPNGGVIVEK